MPRTPPQKFYKFSLPPEKISSTVHSPPEIFEFYLRPQKISSTGTPPLENFQILLTPLENLVNRHRPLRK